jgi:hypothetical protein
MVDMGRISTGLLIGVLFALLPGVARAADGDNSPTPVMKSVQPAEVKAGGTFEVEGEFLGKNNISEVYLTAGGNDIKLGILAQTEKKMKLKVPGSVAIGKYVLMVLTNRPIPNFIEQPVSIKVE